MSAENILNHLIIGKESTFNTAVVPSILLPIKAEGGVNTDPKAEPQSDMRGFQGKHTAIVQGAREHSGSYKMDLMRSEAGHVFLGALGDVSSAVEGGETIVYKHSFSEALAKPSYTAEQKIGDMVRRFSGLTFTGFKIMADPGTPVVQLEIPAIAGGQASASAITPSSTTPTRFTFDQVDVKIGTVSKCGVVKLEAEYKNNAAARHTLCQTKDPGAIVSAGGEFDVTLELLLDAAGVTEYEKMLANEALPLDIVLTGEAIGTASNYKLEIGIPLNKYISGEATYSDDGSAIIPMALKAYTETGSLFDTFDLTNLTTSY